MPDPQDIILINPGLTARQLVAYLSWLVARSPGESVYSIQWPGKRIPSRRHLDCLDANEAVL